MAHSEKSRDRSISGAALRVTLSGRAERAHRVVIVADDFTSATDCGVQMSRGGYRAIVPLRAGTNLPGDVDVIAFDTHSRALTAQDAYGVTRECVAAMELDARTLVYKSMDSTLRGNLGAELSALLDTGCFEAAAIAPAFPTYGRTTLGGVQFLDGVPVDETEFGTDPTAPVATARIVNRFAEQCSRCAHVVPIEVSLGPLAMLQRELAKRLAQGVELFVFDAFSEQHLSQVATRLGGLPFRLLWVGSTGLSRYVPRAVGLAPRSDRPRIAPSGAAVLIVAGSASETTRRQLDVCAAVPAFTEVKVDATVLVGGGAEAAAELARAHRRLEAALVGPAPTAALTLTSSRTEVAEAVAVGAERGLSREQVAALLVETLARLTADRLDAGVALRGLVLTGGDTAQTVAACLEAERVEIVDEVEPGIALGWLTARHDLLIVTKAGGFGSDQSVARSIERIRDHGQS